MPPYSDLLQNAFGGIAEPPPTILPDELELQAIWFAGGFGRDFTTTDGQTVRIQQFGGWNRSAGPDFLHAAIDLQGKLHHGAIELDPDGNDWELHGHGADPAYSSVVLHVSFRAHRAETFIRDVHHRAIPQVVLSPAEIHHALQTPRRATAIARPGRCVHPLAQLPPDSLKTLLEQASDHRSQQKAARFLRIAEAHGRDAALFQVTAETLGYRANALPMRLLAQRAPLAALRELAEPDAVLFGIAGFLSPELHEIAPPDTRQHLRRHWESWWRHRGVWENFRPLPWTFTGQRPANHPHRRVAALAMLVRNWTSYRRRALARPFCPAAVIHFLGSLQDPFWSHRHTLSSKASRQPIALFGSTRAKELLANHLIPLARHEDPAFTYEDYLKLPAGAKNEHVRRCAIRLFGGEDLAQPYLQKAAHHQALLQIYRDFCLEDLSDCLRCPFPEQLSQWR
ncbi:hypothetical protein HNR46_003883 [Haloferula luteola]|uniref:DUF2851 family protein n=1 Tax=Haloferula luteola TaxID=595692 RepID=A0A840V6M9_9BACT|nr:DUF2851 family protein [Haloferula luteola]MBB5353622.1 hypothetical protein [Haloferula luteola]